MFFTHTFSTSVAVSSAAFQGQRRIPKVLQSNVSPAGGPWEPGTPLDEALEATLVPPEFRDELEEELWATTLAEPATDASASYSSSSSSYSSSSYSTPISDSEVDSTYASLDEVGGLAGGSWFITFIF